MWALGMIPLGNFQKPNFLEVKKTTLAQLAQHHQDY